MLITTILTTPQLETESPFIISCDANVHGDKMRLQFIGDYARAMAKQIMSLRTGDVASIGGKVRGGNILIETMTMITGNFKGRNVNRYA